MAPIRMYPLTMHSLWIYSGGHERQDGRDPGPAPAAFRDLPHPPRPGRRGPPRLRHHPGRRRAYGGRAPAQPRHPLSLRAADAGAGADRGDARAARPGAGRRAPPLLPHHVAGDGGRARGGAAAERPAAAGARQRLRAGEGLMRLYRALLHLYPASFRAEYGSEMEAIHAQRLRDATGPLARGGVWVATLGDVTVNGARAHLDILRQDVAFSARTLRRAP